MDEATAYKWAATALEPITGTIEPHLGQEVADRVVSRILAAARRESVICYCDMGKAAHEKLCRKCSGVII